MIGSLTMLFFGMINWTDNWYSEKGRLAPAELATLAAELFLNGLEQTDYSAIRTRSYRHFRDRLPGRKSWTQSNSHIPKSRASTDTVS